MKDYKWFIADALTISKVIPSLFILCFIKTMPIWVAFLLFSFGELLDALDGMAAKRWPHPAWTDTLWFRRNLKYLETGLDLTLGIVGIIYLGLHISPIFCVVFLTLALIAGNLGDLALYGRILGTPANAKENSIFNHDPDLAQKIVGARLIAYLILIGTMILVFLWASEFPTFLKLLLQLILAVAGIAIGARKWHDGRLTDVSKLLNDPNRHHR